LFKLRRVLVTGGAGFIGHHLVTKLLKDPECRITIIDDLSNQNSKKRIKDLPTSVCFYKEDIRNRRAVSDIVKSEGTDTCIHLAAKISVVDSINNPGETIDVNVNGTFSVLEACVNNGVQSFVLASSDAVYGDAAIVPTHEDCVLDPLSPYGASKISGEALVASYGNAGKISNAVSLRFFNAYGRGQSPEYAGVITRFAEKLSKKQSPIIHGDGQQTRDFIHVTDVVDGIILAANSEASGVFNIGTGKATSIDYLARKMIRVCGLDLEPVYDAAIKGDILHSCANTKKSENGLSFVACQDIETALNISLGQKGLVAT
jgi:UDP-glucose 4-epimerase